MWRASSEGLKLLESWLGEMDDVKLNAQFSRLQKMVKHACENGETIFCYDEMVSVLEPLSEKFPIYRFINTVTPYVPQVEKKIDPKYESRLKRLKQEQENREYLLMTRSVDPNQIYDRENVWQGFGEELKAVNRQLMIIVNTLLTVAGGFSFGYFGIGYAYPGLNLDITYRMVLGLVIAAAVFFADLYFIVRGMDNLGEKPIKVKKSSAQKRIVIDSVKKNT